MKKRIFTLLALVTVLSSVFSVAEAQKVVNVGIDAIDGVYRKMDPSVSNPQSVSDSLLMGEYGATKLLIQFENWSSIKGETTVELRYDGVAGYLGLPDAVIVDKKSIDAAGWWFIDIHEGWNFPESMNGGIVSISAKIKGSKDEYTKGTNIWGGSADEYALYRPFFTIDYHPATAIFDGELSVRYTGIPYDPYNPANERWLEDYLGNIKINTTDTLYKSFTPAQIYDLVETDTIIVSVYLDSTLKADDPLVQLSGKDRLNYKIPLYDLLHENENPTNPILRNVKVGQLTNASVNIPNSFQWTSTKDLPFTLTLTGDNVGKVPVLKTDRKTFTGNGEELDVTWKREKNADGTYAITIIRVQENFTIGFDFIDDTANDAIEQNNSAWAANGQLYVTSAVAANAKVYTATGALVKTITLAAGETASTSLATGFYIVTLGDNSYKVVVR